MKLRFYARPGYMFSLPGVRVAGSMPRYIGRTVRVEGKTILNAPLPEPATIDSETPEGKRVLRVMACDAPDYPLWPADENTARACGVPYVDVELTDGEWQPKSKQPKVARAARNPEVA
jgi:hypothetical protein